ncbi:MAG: hypothetical protein GW775_02805 [Candidatus Magasanikbacteria bacterium]|nr:hypothetical protein [Candidatus Magasanikbacteria bacterium]
MLLLYYIWTNVTGVTGSFAGYSELHILNYIFGAHILRSLVFGQPLYVISREINDGTFSRHLVKPLNHMWYFYCHSWAERLLYTGSAIIEVYICTRIFDATLFLQTNKLQLFLFFLSVVCAHVLYYLLSYGMSLIAFWSREAMGPRFLFEWIVQFTSGSFFPLSIVGSIFFSVLSAMPFMYVLYVPLEIYLGRIDVPMAGYVIGIQLLWILFIRLLVWVLWRKGLRRYSGEGI